jgi:hypothetical protein
MLEKTYKFINSFAKGDGAVRLPSSLLTPFADHRIVDNSFTLISFSEKYFVDFLNSYALINSTSTLESGFSSRMSAPFGKSEKYLAGTVWQDTFNKINDNNIKIFLFIIELLFFKTKKSYQHSSSL